MLSRERNVHLIHTCMQNLELHQKPKPHQTPRQIHLEYAYVNAHPGYKAPYACMVIPLGGVGLPKCLHLQVSCWVHWAVQPQHSVITQLNRHFSGCLVTEPCS